MLDPFTALLHTFPDYSFIAFAGLIVQGFTRFYRPVRPNDLILHPLCLGFRGSRFRGYALGYREGAFIVIIFTGNAVVDFGFKVDEGSENTIRHKVGDF